MSSNKLSWNNICDNYAEDIVIPEEYLSVNNFEDNWWCSSDGPSGSPIYDYEPWSSEENYVAPALSIQYDENLYLAQLIEDNIDEKMNRLFESLQEQNSNDNHNLSVEIQGLWDYLNETVFVEYINHNNYTIINETTINNTYVNKTYNDDEINTTLDTALGDFFNYMSQYSVEIEEIWQYLEDIEYINYTNYTYVYETYECNISSEEAAQLQVRIDILEEQVDEMESLQDRISDLENGTQADDLNEDGLVNSSLPGFELSILIISTGLASIKYRKRYGR